MINRAIGFILVFQWASWASTPFESLEKGFHQASIPQQAKILGSWAGHCVHSHDPENRWPAVYVNRFVVDESSNLEKISQTYFWEKNNDPNFFFRFSTDAINRYQPFQNWIKKEQWTPVQITSDGLTNSFDLSQGGKAIRSLRIDETEFNTSFYLKVSRNNSSGNQILSYCIFSKELEPTSNPVPTQFTMHTGPMGNTWVDVLLPAYAGTLKSLGLRKRSTDLIRLAHIEIKLIDGRKLYYSPVQFEKGNDILFETQSAFPLNPVSIRFYLEGWASDLEIYGFSNS